MCTLRIPPIFAEARRRDLLMLVLIGLLQSAMAVTLVLTVRQVFDGLMQGTGMTTGLMWAGGVMVGLAVLAPLVQRAHAVAAESLGQSYVLALRHALFNHLLRLPPRALQARHRGGLTLRFIGDMGAVRRWISLGLSRLLMTGMTCAGVFAVLLWLAPRLAVGLAVCLALGLWGSVWVGGGLRQRTREARRQLSRLAAYVQERVVALSSVQAYGQLSRERRRMSRRLQRARDASVSRAASAGLTRGMAEAVALLAYAVILLVGVIEVASGRASVGVVVAAVTVVGVLLPQLRSLGRTIEYWHGYRVSMGKIDDLLSLRGRTTQVADAPPLRLTRGEIILEQICSPGSVQAVHARVAPGERIAVTGDNGAGKSTLLSLFVRLVDPDAGRILLDGQDIARVRLSSLRAQVALVSRDLPLLRGTVDYNLRYRNRRVDPDTMAQVERMCGIDAMLAQWPEGRRFKLTEGGGNLSAGQRARLMLARAMTGFPRVLLLDEMDSALDAAGRELFDRIIATYPGTIIWVSHDPECVGQADRVWMLEPGGRLVETANTPASRVSELRVVEGG